MNWATFWQGLGVLSIAGLLGGLVFQAARNRGTLLVVWRQLAYARGRSSVIILCIAVSIAIPALTNSLVQHYDRELSSRARTTPYVVGSKGNRIDLTLSSLYFRPAEFDTIPYSEYETIRDWNRGVAVPMNLHFQARGHPIVATTPEYFEQRQLSCARGRLPFRMGEVVLGSSVAADLGLSPGDVLFSDQKELYDISKPAALKMHVVGVLAPTRTPDDQATFVTIKTAWILEGIFHGHNAAEKIPKKLLLNENDDNVTVSGAMIEYNEVTKDNAASFHYHGDTSLLPLSSILFFPRDRKSGTIAATRVKTTRLYQMVKPTLVVEELMAKVFQVKAFLDLVSILLAISTAFLIALVCVLTIRMRRREINTLHQIGIARRKVVSLLFAEISALLLFGVCLAAVMVLGTWSFLPDLIHAL